MPRSHARSSAAQRLPSRRSCNVSGSGDGGISHADETVLGDSVGSASVIREGGEDGVSVIDGSGMTLSSDVVLVAWQTGGGACRSCKALSMDDEVCTAEEAYFTGALTVLYLPRVCVELSR